MSALHWRMLGILMALLCVLCFGVWWHYAYAHAYRAPLTFTIDRTDTGFVLDTLIIPVGSTVTFTNRTTSFMWPASDLHPAHTIYSEFDPKTGIEPGASWSFTFTKEGVWPFHDHLQSHLGGTIVVGAHTAQDVHACDDAEKKEQCWGVTLSETLSNEGLEHTYALLTKLHAAHPDFPRFCHPLTHDIGLKAFRKYGYDVPLIVETGFCNAGFYHGYMEGFLGDDLDPARASQFCTRVGETLRDQFPNAENQCRHGIGHGAGEAFIRIHPELWQEPAALFEKSLAVCRETTRTHDERMRCASGAASVIADWLLAEARTEGTLTKTNPFALCIPLKDEAEKEGCYWELSKRLRRLYDHDAVAVAYALPNLMPQDDYERYAEEMIIESIVSRLGQRVVRGDHDGLVTMCRKMPTHMQDNCLGGVTQGLLNAGEPYNEIPRTLAFCAEAKLSEEERFACYARVQTFPQWSYLHARTPDFCATVPEMYHAGVCLIAE